MFILVLKDSSYGLFQRNLVISADEEKLDNFILELKKENSFFIKEMHELLETVKIKKDFSKYLEQLKSKYPLSKHFISGSYVFDLNESIYSFQKLQVEFI